MDRYHCLINMGLYYATWWWSTFGYGCSFHMFVSSKFIANLCNLLHPYYSVYSRVFIVLYYIQPTALSNTYSCYCCLLPCLHVVLCNTIGVVNILSYSSRKKNCEFLVYCCARSCIVVACANSHVHHNEYYNIHEWIDCCIRCVELCQLSLPATHH